MLTCFEATNKLTETRCGNCPTRGKNEQTASACRGACLSDVAGTKCLPLLHFGEHQNGLAWARYQFLNHVDRENKDVQNLYFAWTSSRKMHIEGADFGATGSFAEAIWRLCRMQGSIKQTPLTLGGLSPGPRWPRPEGGRG